VNQPETLLLSDRDAGQPEAPDREEVQAERADRNGSVRVAALRVALLAFLLLAWEGGSRAGVISEFLLSKPSSIFAFLNEYLQSGDFAADTYTTIFETLVGFAIGAVLGVIGGLLLARFPLLESVTRPFVAAIQSLPKVALAPMFILWFGLGSTSKIYLGAAVVFFIVLIATESGVRAVDEDFMTTTRALGATGRQLYLKVVLPSSIPAIFAGLRLGAVYALLSAIVGEMIAARDGWGLRITYYSQTFNSTGVLGILVVIGLFASALAAVMKTSERRLLRWQDN
jgi:NitT/TauT family transport system permease protein